MQQNLFEKESKMASTSLTISKFGKKTLTKNQQAFNKLTTRIEKLQKEIEKKQLQFDLALKMYGADVYPTNLMILVQRRELMLVLMGHLNDKKLAKNDQNNLKQIIREHLQTYLIGIGEEPDEEVKKIFNTLEGKNYNLVLAAEKQDAIKKMAAELKKMKVDMSGIDMKDVEAVTQKYYQAQEDNLGKQLEEEENIYKKENEKKKSAKQLEAERIDKAVTEVKQKNISTIYKQLAKLFHPDLEQDIEKKVEKEILMKELIAAYEAKNLHALLSLELKWIHKENEHLENLTEEKLAVYLQILKEQAQDLEYEKNEVFHQPQYSVLAQTFGWDVQRYPVQTVQKNLQKVLQKLENFKSNIEDFSSGYALRYIKQMIKQWKQMQEEEDEDEEIMNMMFRR